MCASEEADGFSWQAALGCDRRDELSAGDGVSVEYTQRVLGESASTCVVDPNLHFGVLIHLFRIRVLLTRIYGLLWQGKTVCRLCIKTRKIMTGCTGKGTMACRRPV